MKNIGKGWIIPLSVFFFCLFCPLAWADSVQPTLLEVTVVESMPHLEDNQNGQANANALEVALGLGWMPIHYLTVHAKLGASWLYAIDGDWAYAHHNKTIQAHHLASFDVDAMLEAHLPSRLPALYVEFAAKTFFTNHRAGIFRILIGTGLTFSPFFNASATLRTVQFGVGVRFPLVDDFDKVFGLKHDPAELNLQVLLGF